MPTTTENVVDVMRDLVTNPARRKELGEAGRRFVERFHDYPVVAATYADLIAHVWNGSPLPSPVAQSRKDD
ncbi:MAG: hypothetical protein H0V15_06055 [Solirubrobacterales bacterium]|nr:hypothetical protein [Solirubrobacterales bacterium]